MIFAMLESVLKDYIRLIVFQKIDRLTGKLLIGKVKYQLVNNTFSSRIVSFMNVYYIREFQRTWNFVSKASLIHFSRYRMVKVISFRDFQRYVFNKDLFKDKSFTTFPSNQLQVEMKNLGVYLNHLLNASQKRTAYIQPKKALNCF